MTRKPTCACGLGRCGPLGDFEHSGAAGRGRSSVLAGRLHVRSHDFRQVGSFRAPRYRLTHGKRSGLDRAPKPRGKTRAVNRSKSVKNGNRDVKLQTFTA